MPIESWQRNESDEFRTVWAIRDVLATRMHAEMFFDLVAERLGESAWIETYDGGTHRLLFRRESPGSDMLISWPLVSLGTRGRLGTVVMVAAPEGAPLEPPPRPGRAPKMRGLGPGEVMVHDGPQSATITYGDDGRWKEVKLGGTRETLAGVIKALAKKSAQPVELLAEFVAGLDIGRHGPGRVLLPVSLPGGVEGAWNVGLWAIREALFAERIPSTARWVAADGYSGKAIAWGETREEAISSWRAEVERVRPAPPTPDLPLGSPAKDSVDLRSYPDAGTFSVMATIQGPTSDIPMPEPSAANTPAALIPIAAGPDGAPKFGTWTRLVGNCGSMFPAALRRDEDGFTMLGDRALEVVDLDELDAQLDVADIDQGMRPMPDYELPPGVPLPPKPDCLVRIYRVVDEDTGMAVAPCDVSSWRGVGFHARMLDGDRLRGSAVRQRWIGQ